MAKLTKSQARLHQDACNLLARPLSSPLTSTEKEFILTYWDPSANHINTVAGAFFTPLDLAWDFAHEAATNGSLIDLCAGIGTLAYCVVEQGRNYKPHTVVCVEINPAYVDVGMRILPDALWICADVFEWAQGKPVDPFDVAIANPPFGFPQHKPLNLPLKGVPLDLNVLAIAQRVARNATFIISQTVCPFEFSGRREYTRRESSHFNKFRTQTGISSLECSSIDCSMYQDKWRGVTPMVEIVNVDFTDQPEDEETGGGEQMQEEEQAATTLEDFELDTAAPPEVPEKDVPDNPHFTNSSSDSLLSLTDISKLTGLSYVTLRRYAGVHSTELLPYTEGTGRSLKYKPEAVEMFKKYREESRSGPKPGAGRARTQQPTSTPPPATAAPTVPRPTRGRPAGKSLNPKKKGKPARPHKSSTTIASTPEVAPGPVMQEMTRAMDRAVAEMERAQLVTRLETLRGVVEPINKEIERLEKMLGMVKV